MTSTPQPPRQSESPTAAGSPATTGASYAVVVATRNRGAKIASLLDSILASHVPDFEMVVVDQSTTDSTKAAIEPYLADSRIRYVFSSVAGTSRARNLGMSMTTAPIIAITDDDCTVPPDWLTSMAKPFENPRVGVVFCNVDPVPVSALGYTPHVHFDRSRTISETGEVWRLSGRGLPLGAGMAIRRAVLQQLNGFDEALGPGAVFQAAEDNDLAWRALVRGWFIHHTADVTVMHDGFRTLDEVRLLVTRDFYGLGGTIAKYLRTGHWQITALLFSWLVKFGVADPAKDLLSRRFPRGFRRPYMLLRGLADGLRRPLDSRTLCYTAEDPASR